jgi:signal transduction histidine kinase
LLLLLVGLGSGGAIRRYTSDLAASRDNLRNANADLEGAVEVRTADLQRANDEIQRFAYIISHDLRAPLINVMGFTAELETASRHLGALVERVDAEAPAVASNEARLAVTEDLPESIGFIRSSTQKMERLINAILKLAREGRRSLTPQPLAMTKLITSITDSLEHRLQEPRHQVSATIAYTSPYDLRLSLTGRAFSRQFEDDLNTRFLKGATTFDAAAQVPLKGRLRVGARGENLLDKRIETTISSDGIIERSLARTLWLELRLK